MPEETSKEFRSVEGESDNQDKCSDNKTAPLAPLGGIQEKLDSDRGVGFGAELNFDSLMRKYMLWTDEKPILSRCIVSATTAFLGVLLARATETRNNSRHLVRGRNPRRPTNEGIDILEAISFAVHGGLIAGPLSYYV